MKRPVIISLGEVLWDLFPDGEQFGGAPANFACHAAIHGAEVSLISAVGDDQRGDKSLSILRGHGIDVSLIQVFPDVPTGTVGVVLDSSGKPTFTIHEDSAWDQVTWNVELGSRIYGSDAVYFGTLGLRSEVSRTTIFRAVDAAVAAGIPRILDVNLRSPFFDATLIRESVQRASILKLSHEELTEVCDACGIDTASSPELLLTRLLKRYGFDSVVMTRGAEGAMLATPNSIVEQAGISTTVVDTVGAGDSFTAAFLLGLLHGESPEVNLHNACVVAAAVCSHAGAVPSLQPKAAPR